MAVTGATGATGRVLVVDVGTSSVRAVVFDRDATALHTREQELLPESPADGLVQFDAAEMADVCLRLACGVIDEAGPVDGVGISNQRGSTVVWDRATGAPVG